MVDIKQYEVRFQNLVSRENLALQFKVQLFWEGHKNVRNRPYGFEIYLVNLKKMNFK